MANTVFQLRRNSTSGVRPTTASIQPGELAVNLTDGIVFSTNGATVFELGGNLTSLGVGNSSLKYIAANSTTLLISNTTAVIANGSNGSAGQLLTSNGTGVYWSSAGVNTAAQYTWTNTQIFSANITFSANVFANNVNAVSFTTSNVTVNASSIIVGNTTTAFFANSTVHYLGNSTQNTSGNSTYLFANVGLFLAPQTTSAANTSEGSVFYDITNHALNFYTDDATTPIEVGQQQIFRAVNKTGATLAFGSAVYISGAQGNRPTVALAQANSATTYNIAGFVLSSSGILNNAEGNILAGGLLQGYNTSSFTTGSVLYLSSTTAGALTTTQPSYPNYSVAIGQALNSTSNGRVYVEIVPNYITGIPNTAISISNGSLLTYSNNFTFDYANNVLHVGNSSANASVGYVNAAGSFSFLQIQNAANTSVEESVINQSTGANASADVIVYDSLGYTSNNYLDIGINGNGFSQPSSWTINGPSDGYVYTGNTNLSIGTGGPNYLNFFTGNTLIANERMRITAGGNVGIANSTPDATLKVTGTANVSGNVVVGGALTAANLTASLFTGNVTGTASNATNLGGIAYTSYVNSSQLSSNLNNYALLSGAVFTGQVNTTTLNTSGNVTVGGALVVSGNLYVNSNTFLVNATAITTNDKAIYLANNQSTSALTDGSGFYVGNSAAPIASFLYNNATTSFQTNVGFTPSTNNLSLGGASNLWNLFANQITGTLTTVSQPNITANNANYLGGTIASGYQTTAGLLANVATLTANNATYLNGQLASYYTNATNITTGTLPYAQLGTNVVNTSSNFTISGVYTYNANIVANAVSILVSNATTVTTVNTTGIYIGNTTSNVVISNTVSSFAGNTSFLGLINLKTYIENTSAPAISANTLTLDLSNTTVFNVNLNSAVTTLNITNAPATGNAVSGFVLIFTATGTAYSVSWPAAVRWANGTAPTITSTNTKRDVYTFFTTDNGTSYNAFISGQNI